MQPDGVVESTPDSTLGAPKVAVAVCSSHSGFYALKWALEKEVPANGLVYLVHVQLPLRWIPNAMGPGWVPVHKVHPKKVRQFQEKCFLETEKMVNQYRELCDRKKVKWEVCYPVSDSVQEELVNQISKLGITKLVLGTSQSALSRVFKVESISTYVAKHAPASCDVLVVNKEKLCYVKKGTQVPILVCSLPSSALEASISIISETIIESDEGESASVRTDIQSCDRRTWSVRTDDTVNANSSLEELLYFSHFYHGQRSAPSTSPRFDDSPFTPADPSWDSFGYNIAGLGNRPESEAFPVHENPSVIENGFLDGTGFVHALAPNHTNYIRTSEQIRYPDIDGPSQIEASSIVQTPATLVQRPSWTHEHAGLQTPNTLIAKLNALVVEHGRHRLEALEVAKEAMQQAANDAKRCAEAVSAVDLAWKDNERLQRELAEKMESHENLQMELEVVKRMNSLYATLDSQKVEEERQRNQELMANLEDLSRRLEMERQLRREAEDKTSIEVVAKLDALAALRRERQRYVEYSYEELQSATNGFHKENKLGEGGYGPVYKGILHHTSVAIKVLARERSGSREEFQREVEMLSHIHHPHMLMLLGACPDKGCIVYEYMANGSLEDRLKWKDGIPPLPWYARFRICFEVATALLFLHSQPQPIVHRDLKPGNILLDHHFVSKIGDVGLARLVPSSLSFSITLYKDTVPAGTFPYIDPDYERTGVVSCESDVYALGIVMLQLLTGKPAVGVIHLVEEAEQEKRLEEVLDISAGDWPLEEARKLACISLRCTEVERKNRPRLEADILPILESIQKVVGLAAANMASVGQPSSSRIRPIIPSFFFCPILQDIMEDPYMAADGFTYEHHAIENWLLENDTSPMTNLRLEHKNLTPNYSLRSAIREWYNKGLIQN